MRTGWRAGELSCFTRIYLPIMKPTQNTHTHTHTQKRKTDYKGSDHESDSGGSGGDDSDDSDSVGKRVVLCSGRGVLPPPPQKPTKWTTRLLNCLCGRYVHARTHTHEI